jgi:hypothetical protein
VPRTAQTGAQKRTGSSPETIREEFCYFITPGTKPPRGSALESTTYIIFHDLLVGKVCVFNNLISKYTELYGEISDYYQMGRRVKHQIDLDSIDHTNENPAYWEEILENFGLGMNTGSRPRHESFRGGINELVVAEHIEEIKATGKVKPKGFGSPKEGNGEGRS